MVIAENAEIKKRLRAVKIRSVSSQLEIRKTIAAWAELESRAHGEYI